MHGSGIVNVQRAQLARLVIETLDPLPKDRKCFRMINGVLVERTIEDVLPALKTNSDGLKQVLEEMLKQYKSKQSELDSWKVIQSDFFFSLPSLYHPPMVSFVSSQSSARRLEFLVYILLTMMLTDLYI